jgi:hypothetical protein
MASSRCGSDDAGIRTFVFPESRKLVLTEDLRQPLKELLAPLTPERRLKEALAGFKRIASVGDLVTITLVKAGISPDICVVDFKTKRCTLDASLKNELCRMGGKTVKVRNPAGVITAELWNAIREAYSRAGRTRIEVDGEEDLASLACLSIAPPGTAVIYGMPDMGIEIVPASESTRGFANGILCRMALE